KDAASAGPGSGGGSGSGHRPSKLVIEDDSKVGTKAGGADKGKDTPSALKSPGPGGGLLSGFRLPTLLSKPTLAPTPEAGPAAKDKPAPSPPAGGTQVSGSPAVQCMRVDVFMPSPFIYVSSCV